MATTKKQNKKTTPVWRLLRAMFLGVGLLCAGIVLWALSRPTVPTVETLEEPAPQQPCTIAYLFEDVPNTYEARLAEMPDQGCVKLKVRAIGGGLNKAFNDSNHVQLQAARALGIAPINGVWDAWHLRRPIVEIASCPEYYVDTLTHSYPYLVPEAAQLLTEIGRRFNRALMERGGGNYRIKVTSVTRTPLTVGQLRRINRNATQESCHQYGTTFDFSYLKFICNDSTGVRRNQEDLKNLLAEVLYDLRSDGRCYVKHERKQSCFHITAR